MGVFALVGRLAGGGALIIMMLSLLTGPTIEPITVADLVQHLQLGTATQEPPPATAPTVALAGAAGSVTNGAHRVAVSFVDDEGGETPPGPLSSATTVTDNGVDGQIAVTAIPLGSDRIAKRKVWMTEAGGSTLLLAATINNNTAVSTTLNLADASLGAEAPTQNTTVDANLASLITDARELVEAWTGRQLTLAEWEYRLEGWPACGVIEIPRPPLIDILAVRYLDATGTERTLSSTLYSVSLPAGPLARAGRIALLPGQSWPTLYDQLEPVRIEFEAGYGETRAAVPGVFKRAIKQIAGSFYELRENDVLEKNTTALPKMSVSAQRILGKSYQVPARGWLGQWGA